MGRSTISALLALTWIAVAACSGGASDDDSDDDAGASGSSGKGGGSSGRGGSSTGDAGEGDAQAGQGPGQGGTSGGSGGSGGSGTNAGEAGAGSGRGGSSGATGGGGSGGNAASGGSGGSTAQGAVPAELVGIWQETRASAGDYTNGFGEDFSITSGFSVQLKIAANGSYYFAHFASGASQTCRDVSYFDQSVGVAKLDGDTLTLMPSERRLDVTDCSNTGSVDVPLDPIPLTIGIKDAFHYYGGLRTYSMHVEGGPHPLDLTLLVRPPLEDPEQPAQPSDFMLGADPPYQELQGLWAPSSGSDTTFIDPASGEYYFPELNGSPHQWIRFTGDNYEAASALSAMNAEGVCKLDGIYYETGSALLQVTEDVGGQGNHFVGHMRLDAAGAVLILRVRECGDDDATYTYELPPFQSYYRFLLFTEDPVIFSLDCGAFPQSEWQPMLCTNAQQSYYPR